ncbi:hypothetical protein [Bacteroidetes bacterium endosymbiont of Geopemphigus sp.]|uniref:hypothetical protein n=1 Tax=Bacteroidetes bacterium endosymbiont of Geopemphigus sp. TaxID=2047937 RepID=UPI0011AFD17B|nr:hypothetical protein [Bacteroidetes bacterium endosymbiont of Geopemphigus sp.]
MNIFATLAHARNNQILSGRTFWFLRKPNMNRLWSAMINKERRIFFSHWEVWEVWEVCKHPIYR